MTTTTKSSSSSAKSPSSTTTKIKSYNRNKQPNADENRVRRRVDGTRGVGMDQFAQQKGVTRAIKEFKKRKETKKTATAKSLRKYRKVMRQEGYQAGTGASRKRVEEEGDDDEQQDDAKLVATAKGAAVDGEASATRTARKPKSNPFQKSLDKAAQKKEEIEKSKTEKEEGEKERQKRLLERKKRSKLLSKRTKRGQPIMKNMVNDILHKLEKRQP
jgi:hypothetical protein